MDTAIAAISNMSLKQNLPTFKVGQTVRIHQRIKEGEKERIQVFEGLIIQMSNGTGVGGTITVRKIVDGIGVERVYPIHSPMIAKIEVTKQAKVRRSKLYYMRERTGKSARLKTTLLEGQVFEPVSAAQIAEQEAAAKAEEEAKKAAEEEAKKAAEESEKAENNPAPVEGQPEEAPAEEAAPAEEKTEEAPAEEKKEEAPTETPAAPEEEPQQEAPTEEAPAEEKKEEAPAEEAPAEEKAE